MLTGTEAEYFGTGFKELLTPVFESGTGFKVLPLADFTMPGIANFPFGTTGNLGGWGNDTFGKVFVALLPGDAFVPPLLLIPAKMGPWLIACLGGCPPAPKPARPPLLPGGNTATFLGPLVYMTLPNRSRSTLRLGVYQIQPTISDQVTQQNE